MSIRLIIFFIASFLLAGCSQNHWVLAPKSNEIPTTAIANGKGELVVYRSNPVGILKTPYLAVNAQVFGKCSYKNAVFKILDPGLQTISVGSNKYDVQIVEGQRTYASCIPYKLTIEESTKAIEIVKKLERRDAF